MYSLLNCVLDQTIVFTAFAGGVCSYPIPHIGHYSSGYMKNSAIKLGRIKVYIVPKQYTMFHSCVFKDRPKIS